MLLGITYRGKVGTPPPSSENLDQSIVQIGVYLLTRTATTTLLRFMGNHFILAFASHGKKPLAKFTKEWPQ